MNRFKDLYPFPTFRPGVEELFEQLEAHKSLKYFIIRAKTGIGKSGIAVAISRAEGCHILTATKILQDQYANTKEFTEEFVLKGKSNYTCNLTGDDMNEAPCSHQDLVKIGVNALAEKNWLSDSDDSKITSTTALKARCVATNGCEYYVKKEQLASPNCGGGILNYDLAFLVKPKGKAIVLDEAHNFIDKLLDIYSFEFSKEKLKKLVPYKEDITQTNYVQWLQNLLKLAQIKAEKQGTAADEKLKDLQTKIKTILSEATMPGDFYVESTPEQIVIKPLKPAMIAHKFLNNYERVYFLSATIDASFKDILKLPAAKTAEFSLESTFPIENRPIYFPRNIPNINFKTKFDGENPSIQLLKAIVERHKDQRGIIHTANYRLMEVIEAILGKRDKRFLFVDRGVDKKIALAKHNERPDSVLISPSMMEGVDLKDDLARWQIIFKVPYPAKTDYIAALEETLPGYYGMTTRNSLVQAYGRPVRSESDWAHTYVLDGSLNMLQSQLDPYFTQAVKFGDWQKLKEALEKGKIGNPIKEEE